jgi:gamma-glutamylcyclotransferase (GGCT)/AIG2-like uncharacterized protein YtfP
MPYVFVYGTLKRGGDNHQELARQRFIGPARTAPAYRLYQLDGYPGMVEAPAGLSIEGEIWEVDRDGLDRLDRLEGTDSGLYARVPIRLLPPHDNTPVEAYLYRRSVAGRRDLGTRFG